MEASEEYMLLSPSLLSGKTDYSSFVVAFSGKIIVPIVQAIIVVIIICQPLLIEDIAAGPQYNRELNIIAINEIDNFSLDFLIPGINNPINIT